MQKQPNRLVGNMKSTRVLTGAAFLIALSVILDFFRIIISPTFEISFGSMPIAFAGMLFGPVVGGLVGLIADILQYVVRPSGFFFPGFTLNAILVGVIFGLFFYKKELTLKRLILCFIVEGVLIILVLTPIWLNMMYGTSLFAIPRVIRFVVLLPIKVAIFYSIWKLLESKVMQSNKIFK